MGVISTSQYLHRYNFLRLGLATGLCGSITSFSTFTFQAASQLIRGSLSNGLMMIIYVMSLSYTSYLAGRWVEKVQIPLPLFLQNTLSWLDDSFQIQILSLFVQASLVVYSVLDTSPSSRYYSFALLLGPFGSVLRFVFSVIYNADPLKFPLGTFLANILATVILAMLSTINSSSLSSSMSCLWIAAFSNGFCGSLSTISTFIVELHAMETNRALFYASSSITIACLACFIINGIPIWAGREQNVCSY